MFLNVVSKCTSMDMKILRTLTKVLPFNISTNLITGTIARHASTSGTLPNLTFNGISNFNSIDKIHEKSLHRNLGTTPRDTPHIGRELKSHSCGCLRAEDVGSVVTLCGFVSFIRLEKFIIIRDSHGVTQILLPKEIHSSPSLVNLTYESYVEVKGQVSLRPEGQQNKALILIPSGSLTPLLQRFLAIKLQEQYLSPIQSLATGDVEVTASEVRVLSAAPPQLPFLIREQNKPSESLGLLHRQLQLRFPNLQRNLRIRSEVSKRMRDYLQDVEGFLDVCTPTLSTNTKGGAHLFVVPTEVSPDSPKEFYALAQSPQTYKQLLMCGGVDRYYQFAICYRDEKGTPERQPEFMQLDLEMSDVTSSDIFLLIERLIAFSWPSECNVSCPITPFPIITYDEAISSYGTDKPDTRFKWKISEVTPLVRQFCASDKLKSPLLDTKASAHAFLIPNGKGHITNKVKKSWDRLAALEHSLPGVCAFTVSEGGKALSGHLADTFSAEGAETLCSTLSAADGDTIVLAVGHTNNTLKLLGAVRLLAANLLESKGVVVRREGFSFLWVVDFPLFEEGEEGQLESVHHPFTQPHHEDIHLLETEPLKVRSKHYDLVCNGCEVGGGSERIYCPTLQEKVLSLVKVEGMDYFIDALAMGAPPHAGIALGFDRYISLLVGAQSIREVIAFPKTSQGKCLLTGTPSVISEEQKKRLGLA